METKTRGFKKFMLIHRVLYLVRGCSIGVLCQPQDVRKADKKKMTRDTTEVALFV